MGASKFPCVLLTHVARDMAGSHASAASLLSRVTGRPELASGQEGDDACLSERAQVDDAPGTDQGEGSSRARVHRCASVFSSTLLIHPLLHPPYRAFVTTRRMTMSRSYRRSRMVRAQSSFPRCPYPFVHGLSAGLQSLWRSKV